MPRSQRPLILAVAWPALCAAACSGATSPATVDAAVERPASPWPDWEAGPRTCDAGERRSLEFPVIPADVLILFDRSGSMSVEFGNGGTRYSVQAELLSRLISSYDDKVRFGFQQFPAREGGGLCPMGANALGCCVQPPNVPVALTNGAAIADAIADAAPVGGNTPTAGALRRARAHFAELDDGITDRYVLLSTDGEPVCNVAGQLVAPEVFDSAGVRIGGACHDAIKEVEQLAAAGVKVVVLGIGPEVHQDPAGRMSCLNELAQRGGAPRADAKPFFYSADDPAQLEKAVHKIFGAFVTASCVVELTARPPGAALVSVEIDGYEVPPSPTHGWQLRADQQAIELFGEYCNRIRRYQVRAIEVRYGCPPCAAGEGSCE